MSGWAAAAAGISATGGALSSYFGATKAANMSAKAAREDRAWQEAMSNSAYSRQMRDMKNAGLNPILAYGGKGSSTPGGSTAKVPDFGSIYGKAASDITSSAMSAFRMGMEKKRLTQELDNMKAVEKKDNSQWFLNKMQEEESMERQLNIAAQTTGQHFSNAFQQFRMPAAKAESDFDKSPTGQRLRVWNRSIQSALGNVPIRRR